MKIAFQMDPLEAIRIKGDSTFALMLEAQKRGHDIYEYQVEALTYDGGLIRASTARRVEVRREAGNHFTVLETTSLDLAAVDVVWLRQDPPFDIGYITATYLLERLEGTTLVINDPKSVRDAPEKLYVLEFADYMPPTMITRTISELRAFHEKHQDIVIKPLHGKGGEGVFRVGPDGRNLSALAEMFTDTMREPFIVQAFLPDVSAGDKRIILVDGEVAGAINRIPGKGEFRSNLVAGGSAHKTELTPREEEICAALGPELKRRNLVFTGIDVIGGHLTEINVTSPTGILAMDDFNGTDTPALIWDAIEAKLS